MIKKITRIIREYIQTQKNILIILERLESNTADITKTHPLLMHSMQTMIRQQSLQLMRENIFAGSEFHSSTPAVGNYHQSQFGQDFFVINFFKFKTNGFFVELGAADGVTQSNTFLLEQQYGWKGLLIEPIKSQFEKLQELRGGIYTSQSIKINSAIGITEQEEVLMHSAGLESTWSQQLIDKKKIDNVEKVNKRKLESIFDEYDITHIDYFSLDVEGAELEVLQSINWEKVHIELISVEILNSKELDGIETNYQKIHKLLSENGYEFIIVVGQDFFYKKI